MSGMSGGSAENTTHLGAETTAIIDGGDSRRKGAVTAVTAVTAGTSGTGASELFSTMVSPESHWSHWSWW
jgi:hypothetical protein